MEYIGTVMNVVEGVRNFEDIDEKMKKLKRKCDHLKSREEDVKAELGYAEGLSLKKRRKVVENWLTNVASIQNEVEQMEQQVRESGRLSSYWQLDPKIARLTEEVTELDRQGQFPDGLTLEGHGNQPTELITSKLIGPKFQQHKDVIWEWLSSDNVPKIGIYGMGGVGKTTLVTHIHNELCKCLNSSVSWVTVSQNFSILKLQSDIAKTVGLDIEKESDQKKRAAMLAQRLRKMNNFVLILDDVWSDFVIDELGIPSHGNGCKLILTSRSFEVCQRIGCEEFICVEPLSHYDAWEFFTEILGHGRALSPEIESIAKLLTNKCVGLPLGIKTVAGSMKGVEDISEWRDALEKLKEPVTERDYLVNSVFQVLKWSYDQLKDPKVQQCLLYCSLFPEDYKIDRETLIEHFIDERFVDGLRTRQAELDRGHTMLNKLENVCLLEAGINKYDGKKYVKMHDLVRELAILIARKNFQFVFKAAEQLRGMPGEEKRAEDLKKVSLSNNLLSHIPSSVSPKCPRLTTLMLNYNRVLSIIPDGFFSHMPQLSVLDLSYTAIENLPTSISELVNLIALWLEGCDNLEYVPSLENLKALRRLNLRNTGIREVPQGLDMLSNLRYLNLEGTEIEMIPDGILSKLSCLQYLVTDDQIRWSPAIKKVRGEEIVKLRNLETFKGRLYSMDSFNACVRWWENHREGPINYALLVGPGTGKDKDIFKCYNRIVCLQNCKISKSKGGEDSDSLAVLPKDVQFLYIEGCNDASSVCDIASLNNATKLSRCFFYRCKAMEHVVCCSSCKLPFIQSVVSLELKALWELRALVGREICCASSSASSSKLLFQTPTFSSLQHFEIFDCPKIKRLFMPELLPNLKNLVKLKVEYCVNMMKIIGESSDEDEEKQEAVRTTSIISDENEDEDEDEDEENQESVSTTSSIIYSLPKLTVLWLSRLPKLKRFCTRKIVFDSLKQIQVFDCPKLSFNGDRVHVETYDFSRHTYSVVNSLIGERIR